MSKKTSLNLGYKQNFLEHYELGKLIGSGGYGRVFACRRKVNGSEFAVKLLPKVYKDHNASDQRKQAQISLIKREVEVLLALRGSLSIANLEAVYEDHTNVMLVLELCRGGELLGGMIGSYIPSWSERTIASLIRSALQTVAQCHSLSILHRDVKAENFMFLSKEPGSPLKAIDFGLAVHISESQLPFTKNIAEGTPWYLAPEACRGKWWPATDIWACGILAAYMMTGNYPFIDRHNPSMPDLARTLRAICREDLDLSRPEWSSVSVEAKDFIATLLVKDPQMRPSAVEALNHPWLKKKQSDRPLHKSVVQRLQRFGQQSVFKRTVLEHIAQDLVTMHFGQEKDKSAHGGNVFAQRSALSFRALSGEPSMRGGNMYKANGSTRGGGDSSFSVRRLFSRTDASQTTHQDRSQSMSSRLYLPTATPFSRQLVHLLDCIDIDADGNVNRSDLREALQKLGYEVKDKEVDELFDSIDVAQSGELSKAQLSAGLLDWKYVQDTFKDRWIESVKHVFESLDSDGDGKLEATEIAAALSKQLTDYEVDAAVHSALLEAVGDGENDKDSQNIDFDTFLRLIQQCDGDLDVFDDRLSRHASREMPTLKKKNTCCSFMFCSW